jgi:1-deoxy-D-xylulose-5-phosphate reductoisomerase
VKRLALLGSTGSVGEQALEVAAAFPERFQVTALAAGRRTEKLAAQVRRFRPALVSVAGDAEARALRTALGADAPEIAVGDAGLEAVATADADLVVSALVGAVGLAPTLAAIRAGRDVALANKEVLVMAGALVLREVRAHGVRLLPVDSEHSAIFQVLAGQRREDLRRLVLTASGGPFRTWSAARIAGASVEEALAHPNWQMGPKITIDSATLMNKGLEVIEARWLFDVPAEHVDVVVHPQSVVHSLIELCDGSVLAQLGVPDMRGPIAVALAWPERLPLLDSLPRRLAALDLGGVGRLDFEAPDVARFPCLGLAYAALRGDEAAPAVLNAANEVAVAAFLAREAPLGAIAATNAAVLDAHLAAGRPGALRDVRDAVDIDAWARAEARARLAAGAAA